MEASPLFAATFQKHQDVVQLLQGNLEPLERALERDQGPSAEEGGKASRLVDGHLAKLILNLIKACLGSSILVSSALACCSRRDPPAPPPRGAAAVGPPSSESPPLLARPARARGGRSHAF